MSEEGRGAALRVDWKDLGVDLAGQALAERFNARARRRLLADVGETLLLGIEGRFQSETDPTGERWAPLAPATLRQKKHTKILTETTHLRHRQVKQVDAEQLRVGNNLRYGAIHQFGGEVKRPARKQTLYFRQNKRTGRVGNRFVKRRRSNFAQEVDVAEHTIKIPARPYLGISQGDRERIREIVREHLARLTQRS